MFEKKTSVIVLLFQGLPVNIAKWDSVFQVSGSPDYFFTKGNNNYYCHKIQGELLGCTLSSLHPSQVVYPI